MNERQQRLLNEGVMPELLKAQLEAQSNNPDIILVKLHLDSAIKTLSTVLEEGNNVPKEGEKG